MLLQRWATVQAVIYYTAVLYTRLSYCLLICSLSELGTWATYSDQPDVGFHDRPFSCLAVALRQTYDLAGMAWGLCVLRWRGRTCWVAAALPVDTAQ